MRICNMSCLTQSLEGTVKRGAAAGVLLFADVWACTDASQIPETELDRWVLAASGQAPSSMERIETLEEIGPSPLLVHSELPFFVLALDTCSWRVLYGADANHHHLQCLDASANSHTFCVCMYA